MAERQISMELFELNSSSPATKLEGCNVQIERITMAEAFLHSSIGWLNIQLAKWEIVQKPAQIYNLRVEY